jgi:MATE family multidrug resistance protein
MWFSEVAFITLVAIMMGILGVNVLAAFQIADQYLMIALVILFALSQTAAIRAGNEVGRNDKNQIKLSAIVNTVIAIAIIGCFSTFYLIFPELAIKVDIDINASQYSEVVAETLKFFPLVAILLLTDCIRLVINGTLRGLKDTNFQLIMSILGYWVIAFPLAYLLAFKYNFGGVGIWWGIIVGFGANGIMLIFRFRKLLPKIDLVSLVTKK